MNDLILTNKPNWEVVLVIDYNCTVIKELLVRKNPMVFENMGPAMIEN